MRPEWRPLFRVAVLLAGLLLALSAMPQQKSSPRADRPELTAEQKAQLRDLQYQITKIEATMMQLQIQFQQLQQQHEQLSRQLRDEIEKVKKGVDTKQWVFDAEKLEFVPSASPKQ
jgi:predicted  nucleic acid-binding Zn-ribbon protein